MPIRRAMRVHELFESVQGEGIWQGVPSYFIRVAGCNLRCTWCDTARARRVRGAREMTVAELVRCARLAVPRHVVITGGEPALYPGELAELCRALRRGGKIVTVETNATKFVDCNAHLMSLSPKYHAWRHEVLAAYCAHAACVQIKLVAGTAREAEKLWRRVAGLDVPREHVFIMPRARTRAEHDTVAAKLVPWCIAHNVRFALRAQTVLWNNAAGR